MNTQDKKEIFAKAIAIVRKAMQDAECSIKEIESLDNVKFEGEWRDTSNEDWIDEHTEKGVKEKDALQCLWKAFYWGDTPNERAEWCRIHGVLRRRIKNSK